MISNTYFLTEETLYKNTTIVSTINTAESRL